MTLRRQIVDEEEDEEDEEEEAEVAEEEEEEDGHENVCHGCGSTGTLHCCSTCRHAYCDDCLTLGCRVGLDEPDWRCPVCTGVSTGRAIGNPQRGRAQVCGKYRARKRSRTELAPAAGRAAKRTQYARDKGEGKRKLRLR